MRKEYDFSKGRPNPYAKRLKRSVTIRLDERPEYRFDYSKAKPNPYAERLGRDTVTVVLDPDVAAVFSSSESVNTFLRSVIAVLPARPKRRSTKRAG